MRLVQRDREMEQIDLGKLTQQFRDDGVVAIVLMGSFARGDAGRYSDIDLVRFLGVDGVARDAQTHLVDQMFVVVSDMTPSESEAWFADPDKASSCIAGVRSARPLWDPHDYFADIQKRAQAFVWDEPMQAKADVWASGQMVGWIEEVQKGLEGLRRHDTGRMLNARHGLSWGLTDVVRVQRGILITGDNTIYPEVAASFGHDSPWVSLSRQVFGISDGLTLAEQVSAGLWLYVLTVDLLGTAIQPEDEALLKEAVRRIERELAGSFNNIMHADADKPRR